MATTLLVLFVASLLAAAGLALYSLQVLVGRWDRPRQTQAFTPIPRPAARPRPPAPVYQPPVVVQPAAPPSSVATYSSHPHHPHPAHATPGPAPRAAKGSVPPPVPTPMMAKGSIPPISKSAPMIAPRFELIEEPTQVDAQIPEPRFTIVRSTRQH
jgi:hypothetical protein